MLYCLFKVTSMKKVVMFEESSDILLKEIIVTITNENDSACYEIEINPLCLITSQPTDF